jgi:DNA primase
MNEVEEIKKRLDIAEVIGGYLALQRAGGANLKARCPFHQEKTPSFYVSRDRQMWHCFGCGEGGDLFSFVMKIEGLDFREALRLLADRAGVKLPEYRPEEVSERRRLMDALALSARFYSAFLKDAPQAGKAREYVSSRGIKPELAERFGIGYAPGEWDGLIRALGKRGVKPVELEKAGLVSRRERGSGYYDRFRDRLMFPIRDVNGQTVGFTGRVLDPEAKEAKYVNTPQTALYNKSAVLYGLDLARQSIRVADLAVVVEGNMDVITCHGAGFANTVAASGTALSEEHLRLLGRFTKNIAIAFDADSAGREAAKRGIDLAIRAGFSVRVITLPEGAGKDPDDCVKKDPELWRLAVSGARHYMDYLIEEAKRGVDLGEPLQKKKIGGELVTEMAKIPDAIEQTHWLQRVSSLINVSEAVLREEIEKVKPRKKEAGQDAGGEGSPAKRQTAPVAPDRMELLGKSLIALLGAKPNLAGAVIPKIPDGFLPTGNLRELYNLAVSSYTQTGEFALGYPELGRDSETKDSDALRREILFLGERDYAPFSDREAEVELETIMSALSANWKKRRVEDFKRRMAEAERLGDREEVAKIEGEVKELMLGS